MTDIETLLAASVELIRLRKQVKELLAENARLRALHRPHSMSRRRIIARNLEQLGAEGVFL